MFCICLYKSICTPLYPWSNFLKSISPKFNCWYTLASLVAQLVKNPPTMQKTSIWSLGWEDPLEKGIHYPLQYSWASLVAEMVKNLPATQETWVQSLGWEDALEKGKATHFNILDRRIPRTEKEALKATVHGVAKSWTQLSDFHLHTLSNCPKERKSNPHFFDY